MRTTRSNGRRGGFAIILAITLLGLVAATLVMLATMFAGEAKRTSTQAAEAQARQLLVAGAMVARANGDALAAGKPVAVQLPPALASEGVKLTVAGPVDAVRVEALVQGHPASQELKMRHDSGGWKITAAELK